MKKILFTLLFALVGLQSAFALRCEGTIHVKVPSSWSSPNIMIDGSWIKLPATALQNGWCNGFWWIDFREIYFC